MFEKLKTYLPRSDVQTIYYGRGERQRVRTMWVGKQKREITATYYTPKGYALKFGDKISNLISRG